MIPTYNESGNIRALIEQILALKVSGHEIGIQVVDDDSPDGTADIVGELAKAHQEVKLLVRKNRRGRGTAGLEGFQAALRNGADFIIEMDADFSHNPKYIADLLAAADKGADMVLGSRFVPGGADEDRGPLRRIITKCAGLYARTVLGLDVKDITGGFRCFRRKVLETIDLGHIMANGPGIVPETLYKASVKGFKIVEVPIVFIDRRVGESKLDWTILFGVLTLVGRLRILKMTGRLFHRSDGLPKEAPKEIIR